MAKNISPFALPVILVFIMGLVGCVSTEEATYADHHGSNDGEFLGPGVFSGDKGGFSLSDVFGDSDKRRVNADGTYATSSDVNVPAIDQQSFEDFENFKAWRRAQDPDSPNYQEYQDWRAYQQYRRFKAQQPEEAAKP